MERGRAGLNRKSVRTNNETERRAAVLLFFEAKVTWSM
jgi:hypothetical protein